MITVVKGKNIETIFEIVDNIKSISDGDGYKYVYTAKPCIVEKTKIISWGNICKFKGQPYYIGFGKHVNISEDETVKVEKEVFRADLNELHLFTNKVMNVKSDYTREEAERDLETEVKKFNKMMIESNDTLLSYCEIHNLKPEDTDCIKLFKLAYNHGNYEIVNGIMKEKKKYSIEGICDYIDTGILTAKAYTDTNTISALTSDCTISAAKLSI